MLYVDHMFYKENYKGVLLNEADFEKYAIRAENYISNLTFGRLNNETVSENIKLSICAAAEVFCELANSASLDVASENTDGYSVNYITAQSRQSAQQNQLLGAVNIYFPPSHPLRYRGRLHEKSH